MKDGNVTHKFKDSNIKIINLEKVVNEKRSIDIQLEGSSKGKIDKVIPDTDSIRIKGPRVLVNKVQKIVATLDVRNKVDDFTEKLKLYPVDKNGERVEGVDLESSVVNVTVTLLKQKNVPIKINYTGNENEQDILNNYKITPDTINIKGTKDIIDSITYIETKPLDLASISNNTSNEIALEIPNGVITDTKYITIKLKDVKPIEVKPIKGEIIYSDNDVEVRNLEEGFDISKLNIPKEIKVSFENDNSSELIDKSDILLYIDLNTQLEDGTYEIKYETNKDINNIEINPNKTSI